MSDQELFHCADVVFCLFFAPHFCVGLMGCNTVGGFQYSKGRGETAIAQEQTVNFQHGAELDGNLHPCIQG